MSLWTDDNLDFQLSSHINLLTSLMDLRSFAMSLQTDDNLDFQLSSLYLLH